MLKLFTIGTFIVFALAMWLIRRPVDEKPTVAGAVSAPVSESALDSSGYQELAERSMVELKMRTEAFQGVMRLNEPHDWNLDQGVGDLILTFDDGYVVKAPAQIIGSFNTEDQTWLWSWGNSSTVPAMGRHAAHVHDYGSRENLPTLTTAKLSLTETEAWELAAIACHLNEAQGVYCGSMGPLQVFLTFGEVHLSRPDLQKPVPE